MCTSISFSRSHRIANALLLNSSFIDNLGLMHGKIGIAIYFFHLARETKTQMYEDYAGELIDEIYDEITVNTPLDFENGLAGIGWGIEHLVQNGFIEADTDEVLSDFDSKLFQQLIYATPSEININNGIIGIGMYFLKRVQNRTDEVDNILYLTNKQLLIHIIDDLYQKLTNIEFSNLINEDEDLLWNYPILIWFLTELHKINVFNFKVEKLIRQSIDPLMDINIFPKKLCKRLLLVLALENLKNIKIEHLDNKQIEEIILVLISKLNRETIALELSPNSVALRNGTSGITWIYQQLFRLTGNQTYRNEALHWNSRGVEVEETEQGFVGFHFAKGNESRAFGIFEGLAGIDFMNQKIKHL